MSTWLQKQWYRLSLWHLLLLPASWLFWLLSTLRRLCYRLHLLPSYQLPVPVIVIGNISVGGTGKTPLAIWLAERLKQSGYRPAIISRGYGGSIHGVSPVYANSDPVAVGDEPVLLAKRSRCPVWVGRDRVAVAMALLKAHPECNVIISDDGLQHYKLQRDVEIVVVDGARGFGNGWLIPAGPLRESESRIKTADAIVYNGGKSVSGAFTMTLESAALHNLVNPTKTASVADFFGQHVYAIAGIGNPERFFHQLQDFGLQFEQLAFPDHHVFQAADLQSIKAEAILMTEKDAVKCSAFAQPNWWYLPVNAMVDEALANRILNKLRM
jgi:tetraacyldisaccharide 4'-kinase